MVEDELSEMSKIELEVESYDWHVDDKRRKAILHWITEWIYLPGFVKHLKTRIHLERFFSRMQILSLYGMAGIGKSTLTRKIYKDTSVVSYFDHHLWVTLGPKYQPNEIVVDVLA